MSNKDCVRKIDGRDCTSAPEGIALFPVGSRLSDLEGLQTNGRNKKRPSYNYGADGCKIKCFIDEADTAYSIEFPKCAETTEEICPDIPECSDGTTVISGIAETDNPNCKLVTVAVSRPINNFQCGAGECPEWMDCLARKIIEIADAHSITIDATTVFVYGDTLNEFPICELLECIEEIRNEPPLITPPNPEVLLLCEALCDFPIGDAMTLWGKDIDGNCVQTASNDIPVTVDVTLVSGNVTVDVNGVSDSEDLTAIFSSLLKCDDSPFDVAADRILTCDGLVNQLSTVTTNVIDITGTVITSTVNGVDATVDLAGLIPDSVTYNKCDSTAVDPNTDLIVTCPVNDFYCAESPERFDALSSDNEWHRIRASKRQLNLDDSVTETLRVGEYDTIVLTNDSAVELVSRECADGYMTTVINANGADIKITVNGETVVLSAGNPFGYSQNGESIDVEDIEGVLYIH